jgi:hypothetical protein
MPTSANASAKAPSVSEMDVYGTMSTSTCAKFELQPVAPQQLVLPQTMCLPMAVQQYNQSQAACCAGPMGTFAVE